MTEQYPSNAALEALSNTADDPTGVYYPQKGAGLDWYAHFARCIHSLVTNVRPVQHLRVYKDGDLTFGLTGGSFFDGTTLRTVSAATAQSLTDNQTNYIYVTAGGTLTVNTTGFPDAGTTTHLRLATIVAASGTYDVDDITDYRGAHTLGLAGLIGTADVADALADAVPTVHLTVGDEDSNEISVTAQVRDVQGNDLAGRFLLRVWLADAANGGLCATAPNGGVTISTGTTLETITANKYYLVITDADGTAVIDVSDTGTPTLYVHVELDGVVYASDAVTFTT